VIVADPKLFFPCPDPSLLFIKDPDPDPYTKYLSVRNESGSEKDPISVVHPLRILLYIVKNISFWRLKELNQKFQGENCKIL